MMTSDPIPDAKATTSHKLFYKLPNCARSKIYNKSIIPYHHCGQSVQLLTHVSLWLFTTLCNPMDCSMPGLPVHCQLLEFTETHVHWVGDAIQPSHPLSSPSPPDFILSQHQGLFRMSQFFASCGQSIGVSASASVLPMNIQDWFPLGWTGWISLQSKGLSRVFSNTTVQKHQFFGAQYHIVLLS